MFVIASALVIAVLVALSPGARAAEHPPTVTPDGTAPLPQAGQATRVRLFGLIEIYSLAVYADGSLHDRARLLSPDVPKALRIEIKYEEDVRRQIRVDWRRELVPLLTPGATAHLRGTFAPLKRGDVVLIEFVPGRGTAVRVNSAFAVTGAHHDLMLAFLDHWLGQRPVSEEMKRALVASS